MKQTVGLSALVLLISVSVWFVWRRRNRLSMLAQLFQPSDLTFAQPQKDTDDAGDTLTALEKDFGSDSLRESRSIRDEFLRDILGDQVDATTRPSTEDSAIRINRSLKSLLISDPAQYKSIFLNWIFMAKVGSALNEHTISLEDLNGQFGREFNLLQNYFNIHLLELDDRHKIRRELPGLFYCLQIAKQTQRHVAGEGILGTA